MSLSFGTPVAGGNNSSSTKLRDGIFGVKGRINGARVEYNTAFNENSQYRDDIALRLSINIGKEWMKDIYIAGNFKRDVSPQGGQGQISGWGSAFKVARVFDVLGIQGELDDDGRMDQNAVNELIGREICYLQYVRGLNQKGKPAYADYRLVDAPQNDDEELPAVYQRLLELFDRDLNGGYLKNFKPQVLGQQAGGDGATVEPTLNASIDTSDWV